MIALCLLLPGLVKAVARDLYNQDAEISVIDKTQEIITGGKTQEHVAFRVVLTRQDDTKSISSTTSDFMPCFPSKFLISAEQFCNAFPYHIVFDSELRIQQSGMMIQRLLGVPVTDRFMYDIFELTHPRMKMTVNNIRMFINAVFMLKVDIYRNNNRCIKRNGEKGEEQHGDGKQSLVLKGKFVPTLLVHISTEQCSSVFGTLILWYSYITT